MSYPKIRKAIIPAAGFGTRFLPIAKAMPKEMLPIVGCRKLDASHEGACKIIDGTPTEEPGLLRVHGIEKKAEEDLVPGSYATIGRYILTPDIFDILEMTRPGEGGEIHLTDALRVLAKTFSVYAYNFHGIRYNTGDKLGYLEAMVEFALRREDLGPQFKEYLRGVIVGLR